MSRPDREEYYMAIAELASTRSTCVSRRVGCVLVKDDNPISFGYNGPARGMTHCSDIGGCVRRQRPDYVSGAYLELCPASHAEQNAIAFAARNGISCNGATAYVNTFPCKNCMNSLINAGIKKIVYNCEYNADLSSEIANTVGIELKKFEGRDLGKIVTDFGYVETKSVKQNKKK